MVRLGVRTACPVLYPQVFIELFSCVFLVFFAFGERDGIIGVLCDGGDLWVKDSGLPSFWGW